MSDGTNDQAESMGRVRARNLGSHLHGIDPHLDSPIPGFSALASTEVTSLSYPPNRAWPVS